MIRGIRPLEVCRAFGFDEEKLRRMTRFQGSWVMELLSIAPPKQLVASTFAASMVAERQVVLLHFTSQQKNEDGPRSDSLRALTAREVCAHEKAEQYQKFAFERTQDLWPEIEVHDSNDETELDAVHDSNDETELDATSNGTTAASTSVSERNNEPTAGIQEATQPEQEQGDDEQATKKRRRKQVHWEDWEKRRRNEKRQNEPSRNAEAQRRDVIRELYNDITNSEDKSSFIRHHNKPPLVVGRDEIPRSATSQRRFREEGDGRRGNLL